MQTARYTRNSEWWEIEWPTPGSIERAISIRCSGTMLSTIGESRHNDICNTNADAVRIAQLDIDFHIRQGWRLSSSVTQLFNEPTTHEPENTEEESSDDNSSVVDLHGDGNTTNIPVDEEETSTESFESSSSSSPMPPSIVPARRAEDMQSRRHVTIAHYSVRDGIHLGMLWDLLAVDFPKQNERRAVIAEIQAARRDRLETEERLRRVRELENTEREEREVSQAEGILKRAAERATANGAFERRKRRISLQDE